MRRRCSQCRERWAWKVGAKKCMPCLGQNEIRRKASRRGHHVSEALRRRVIERYGPRCVYCGTAKNIEMDHVLPVIAGGATTIENLRPACRLCNRRKRDRVLDPQLSRAASP